ncbi:ABC transporter ATP-binding protein [Petrocella atlantisensis]|uniref:ABC transporter ATP-binding protein n=1 Tax=Petrocella atlantisensis TaxID=2173034 RepID=A0A3P7PH18_9FIRM|nr:ATP-binding cassette domain-containing protein [Petrocella atlantisensis]PKM54147.1 MAG: ABC transporter ATP-binding protein [Firmicutes bacterium HGW-Firmicutes-5]VDN49323.1 ABC transporter ATP-binding protein [Petrocella atlantisensis]
MIEYIDISKSYGDKELFKNFNLEIKSGEKVLLSASSGSGKTTLIRFLLGFDKPDSGDIIVDDMTLNHHNLRSIREKIAYVSQDIDLPSLTTEALLDKIFSYKVNHHIKDYKDNFLELSKTFQLDGQVLSTQIQEFSGGERQRIGLIIALLLNRPYLLLDEITSGLDHDLKALIMNHIMNLDATVIIVSHDALWKSESSLREVTF